MKSPQEIVKEITQTFTGGDYCFQYITPEECLKAIQNALNQDENLKCVGKCDFDYKDEFGNDLFCSIKEKKNGSA